MKTAAENSIFICYRRADSEDVTGRVYDLLAARFGPKVIFRDVDTIPIGVDFPQYIQQRLATCQIGLVMMGPRWLEAAKGEQKPRLYDEKDYVRLEVSTMLGRPDLKTIPVFIGETICPPADLLPEEIRGLAMRNGVKIRPDPDFHPDMARLISRLCGILDIEMDASDPIRRGIEAWQAEREKEAQDKRRREEEAVEEQRKAMQWKVDVRRDQANGCLFLFFFLLGVILFLAKCGADS